uniref:Sodium/nucleoside cotransporter n=1 Tax=Panagrolaimus sp. JU765 TaxID=591449 RepID=A0AC34QV91_9BILA
MKTRNGDLEPDFEDDDEIKPPANGWQSSLAKSADNLWQVYRSKVILALWGILIVGVHIFYVFAAIHNFHRAGVLLLILCIGHAWWIQKFFIKPFYERNQHKFSKKMQKVSNFWNLKLCGFSIVQTAIFGGIAIGFLTWLAIDARHNTIRYRSLAAVFVYVLLGFLISANPAKIKWRPVFGGFFLQILVAFLVLRWESGNQGFKWLADNVVRFLDYSQNGTRFVYGFVADPPPLCDFGGVFIYTSLQIIIYFGAIVAVLYYLGVIQVILSFIAFVMQSTVGTTAAESLNAAACIFLGQTEAAILIEPALSTMTESEIHAVMTAGFACIAGSLFSAYIAFGACPTYLLSATVMSAAISLAMSKLIYPEIQKSKQREPGSFKFAQKESRNILECISNGACHASGFVFAIGANLIVYIALLAMANTWAHFVGTRLGFDDWSFNKLMGYIFFPLAYMMGASDAKDSHTEIQETLRVAELMGMKTILNEFIAYNELKAMVADGRITGARAQMIATYALCGFSNISMIGSQLGILGAMCPKRKATFAKVVLRALIAGCMSCFVTASVAGMLVDEPTACSSTSNCPNYLRIATINETLSPYFPEDSTFF